MAHLEQIDFCTSIRERFPSHFSGKIVLDIGSLDINGSNQYLFDDCLYVGVDVAVGRNVDICAKGHELGLPSGSIDTIISTECFEHDQYYAQTLKNIVRMLKPGGFFLFTCATTGRPEHGTRRSNPQDAPLIQDLDDWADYYNNLTSSDIEAAINLKEVFDVWEFSVNEKSHDLYFWGVKTGASVVRTDYSFLINEAKTPTSKRSGPSDISTTGIALLLSRLGQREEYWLREVQRLQEQLRSNQAQASRQRFSLEDRLLECGLDLNSLRQRLAERDGDLERERAEFKDQIALERDLAGERLRERVADYELRLTVAAEELVRERHEHADRFVEMTSAHRAALAEQGAICNEAISRAEIQLKREGENRASQVREFAVELESIGRQLRAARETLLQEQQARVKAEQETVFQGQLASERFEELVQQHAVEMEKLRLRMETAEQSTERCSKQLIGTTLSLQAEYEVKLSEELLKIESRHADLINETQNRVKLLEANCSNFKDLNAKLANDLEIHRERERQLMERLDGQQRGIEGLKNGSVKYEIALRDVIKNIERPVSAGKFSIDD